MGAIHSTPPGMAHLCSLFAISAAGDRIVCRCVCRVCIVAAVAEVVALFHGGKSRTRCAGRSYWPVCTCRISHPRGRCAQPWDGVAEALKAGAHDFPRNLAIVLLLSLPGLAIEILGE